MIAMTYLQTTDSRLSALCHGTLMLGILPPNLAYYVPVWVVVSKNVIRLY